jgi:hypothetical protein
MYPAQTNRAEVIEKPDFAIGERRRRVRHRVHTPAYVGVNGSPTAIALDLSEILDISEEGICIQAMSALQVDRVLNLCLELSDTSTRINVSGVVAWADAPGRTGIRLLQMPESARRSLKEWLFLNALTACDAVSSSPRTEPGMPQGGFDHPALPFVRPQRNVVPGVSTMPGDSSFRPDAGAPEVKAARSDLDQRLQRIAERAFSLTRASGAAIALMRSGQMICVARAGADAPGLGSQIQVGSGFSGECLRSRKLLVCDDSETDPRVDRETCRALGIRAILAVPVCSGSAVAGLLEVFSPHAQAFSLLDPIPIERLAHDILLAIDWSMARPTPSAPAAPSPRSPRIETPVRSLQPVVAPAAIPRLEPAELARPTIHPCRSTSRSRKVVLSSAVAALVFTGVWLVFPWVRTSTRMSQGVLAETRSKPRTTVSKPATPVVPPANDFENLRWLAQQGDPTAQFALGLHYAQGEEVRQDDVEAARWFSQAAAQGHIVAQATLGSWYWAGRGVPKDVSKAYFWLVLARAGGYERSKDLIGPVTAEMTRSQVLTAQQEANEWLTHHRITSKTPSDAR